MNSYLEYLAKQYIKAKGIKSKRNLNDPKFVEDLLFWIREMNEIGNKYTTYLEELGLDFDRSTCAEVGRSELDTVVAPYETTIITPVSKYIPNVDRNRIINANVRVSDNTPYLVRGSKKIVAPTYTFDTYMTQNIYTMSEVANWDNLHNGGKHSIIVGAFGYAGDKDIYPKLNQIHRFQERLDSDVVYDYSLIGDSFVVVAATKVNEKQKVLVKTR